MNVPQSHNQSILTVAYAPSTDKRPWPHNSSHRLANPRACAQFQKWFANCTDAIPMVLLVPKRKAISCCGVSSSAIHRHTNFLWSGIPPPPQTPNIPHWLSCVRLPERVELPRSVHRTHCPIQTMESRQACPSPQLWLPRWWRVARQSFCWRDSVVLRQDET